MDVSFTINDNKFNYRVGAVILNEDKILTVRLKDHYFLPGGRVKMFETADKAIERELKEELTDKFKINRILWFHQNYFPSENIRVHEICFYYLVEIDKSFSDKNEFIIIDNETNEKLNFKWFSINDLDKINFVPNILKEKLKNIPPTLEVFATYE